MSSNAKSYGGSIGPIIESFLNRRRQGEHISIDECVEAHPDLADELREVIPSALMLEELKAEVTKVQNRTESGLDSTHPMQIGDYRILREIGRGGMGIVYEAEEPRLTRSVALKVLPAQASLRPDTVRRFRREARAAAQLHHTGIVHVYGCGEDGGIHYIVMEYVTGHGLDQIVTALQCMGDATRPVEGTDGADDTVAGGPHTTVDAPDTTSRDLALALLSSAMSGYSSSTLGHVPVRASTGEERERRKKSECRPAASQLNRRYWRNVAWLGLQIAEALEHAHCRGIVHRDIKPSNLLLDDRGVVRITDFGLAKAETVGDLTQSENVLGTLRYLPPEGLKGAADVRSDVYSLGLTLFELTTLTPARGATGRNELVRQIVDQDVPRARRVYRGIPRDLDTIIQKATNPDSLRRYQTAGDMAADLQRFLLDQPIRARRTHALELIWRGCRRNPLAVTVAVAAVVAVAVAVGSAFILVHAEKLRALEVAGHNAALAQAERRARHEAEEARQEQERSAHVAKTVTDVLVRDLILLARADLDRGDQVTLRDAVDRAAGRLGNSFEGQPEIRAGVQEAIGLAYFSMGLYEQAHSLLNAAFVWRRDNLGFEKLDTLRAMLNLAACHDRRGEHSVSQELQQEAIELLRASYGTDSAEALRARINGTFLLKDAKPSGLLPTQID